MNGKRKSALIQIIGKFEKPREIAIGIVLCSGRVMRPLVLSDQVSVMYAHPFHAFT